MKILMTIFAAMVLSACTTSTVVRTGEMFAPISTDQVRVFFKAPDEYRVLGLVDAHSDIVFSNRKAQERAIKRLVEEAAAIGANGVLITFEADYPTETLVFDPELPIYTVDVDFTKVISAEAILIAPTVASN
jgi:hypothetical protein